MKHDYLIKNTILLFINKFSGALATFILLPVYTKYFSSENYGAVDLTIGYVMLVAPILSLRLDMGIFKHLVDVRGNDEETRRIISNAFYLIGILSMVFVVLMFALGVFVHIPFHGLVVLAILANVFFAVMSQITRGIGLTKDFVVISMIVTGVSFFVSIIGTVIMHINAEIMLIALIVSQFIGTALLAMRTQIHTFLRRKSVSRQIQKELLKYSAPLVADGASFWVMNTSSRTILTVVIGVAANGIYAVASKFAMIIEQVIGVFFQAFIETATLYAKKPNKSELYSDVLNKYLQLFWSGCILLIAAMPFIFPILVKGEAFASAALLVPILIVAVMARAVQNFLSAVYQANGYTKQIAATTIMGAVVNLVVNIGLIFVIGIWAAAVASLVSYVALSIYRYFDIRKYGIVLRLRGRSLIVFVLLVLVTLTLYYIEGVAFDFLNAAIALASVIMLNRRLVLGRLRHQLKKIPNRV